MQRLRLYLFGSPRIELDGQPVKVETRKTIALLTFLGWTGESYRRDSLVNLLWPEYDLTHGRGVLRRTLSALNSVLPEGWIHADRETIGLSSSADLWLDVREFHRLLVECRAHGHAEEEVCQACQPLLSSAAALYRDDFMSGFSLPDSYNFDDWQYFQAEGLRQELNGVLARLVRCLILKADFNAAIEHARRRLALDRLNEDAHRDLILLFSWAGQRSNALRQYQECLVQLKNQLNVEPQIATINLWHSIEANRIPAPPSDPAWQLSIKRTTGPLNDPSLDSPPPPHQAVEEKRILTVLVCEISLLSPSREPGGSVPEEGASLLDRFLALASSILSIYGGIIRPGLGGSVLIVFGLGHSRENDPELAVRAVVEIRAASERTDLCLTAGIASGEVYIRQDKQAGQDGIHLSGAILDQASHLASHALCGQVLVAESTYQFCRRAFKFTSMPDQVFRSGQALPVYCLDHLLPAARKAHGIENLYASLVGRENEMSQLINSIASLRSGHGQMVALIGEAGVGKSRMLEEAHEALFPPGSRQTDLLWLEGRCLELSIDTSYWPFVDLLKQFFSWHGQEDAIENERQVSKSVKNLVLGGFLDPRRGEEMIPLFCRLFTLRKEDVQQGALARWSPEEIRQHTFLSLRDFLLALSHRQALVLVFEDLHWADRLSLDLISLLMETLDRSPILLLCVYRPDQEYRTFHLAAMAERKCRTHFTVIRLFELTRMQSFQLVDGLLGSSGLSEQFKNLVWERCQGNPYFIEEILKSLIDADAIYREGQDWKTNQNFDATQLPAGIQSILLSRLDHLDEDWQDVLQTSAVIGRVFGRRILERALRSSVDMEKALWELEGRGLIYQERTFPEVEFSFHHVLMQEAVYHNILRHRRKILHQRVAEAIEALYPGNLEEQAEQLAYHYEKSGDIIQTIAFLYRAGEKARSIYSNEAAISHFTKGLELLRSLPETPDRNRQELDFLIKLGVPLVHLRGHADPDVLRVYEGARNLCLKTGDRDHLFEALLGLRRYFLYHGQIKIAHEYSQQMLDLVEITRDSYQRARAFMMMSEVFYREGHYPEMTAFALQGMVSSEPLNPRTAILLYGNDTYLGCHIFYAIGLWHQGKPDQALAAARKQLDISHTIDHPFTHELTLYLTANLFMCLRLPLEVKRLAEEELRIADERGFSLYQAWGSVHQGYSLVFQDRAAAGIEAINMGLARMEKHIFGLPQETIYVHLGEAYLRTGQPSLALQVLEAGLQAANASDGREWEAEFWRLKGEAQRQESLLDAAERSFQFALEVARRQSSRGFELRAASSLARLWQAQGKSGAAVELLLPVFRGFGEGFDTPDLIDARTLLDEMRNSR